MDTKPYTTLNDWRFLSVVLVQLAMIAAVFGYTQPSRATNHADAHQGVCHVIEPHVILSLAEPDREILEDLFRSAGMERQAHATGNGDQDIMGKDHDIALVVGGSQELAENQTVVFEANDPRACAEQVRTEHALKTGDQKVKVKAGDHGFFFVPLRKPNNLVLVVGFRPHGALHEQ